ncbi:hypothetical protein [Bradyrhizobium neotropicale]|uniref:Uncharacterized protein n=1 Tax=Bradyrhizobium neotropicale TaxID=1497615 RepID=A0A176ZIJ6_9BRAD|nr:hypothetical protein [Bradyrhizobium neotropicale]OAF19596.1 hypothetical protein AXW67_02160 [Bradyrhizobium neotropicale]
MDWSWSSTCAHLWGRDEGVTTLAPIKDRFLRCADLLDGPPEPDLFARLHAAESGRLATLASSPLSGDWATAETSQAWTAPRAEQGGNDE